jgi:3-oxoacyl-[acyl-carrier-protein] synthase II
LSRRRVVVTGLGIVSPVGIGVPEAWQNIVAGRSGITRITRFDPSAFSSQIAGEVKGFEPAKYLSAKEVRRFDTFIHYGLAAGMEAIKDSGLDLGREPLEQIGVCIGSGIGGLPLIEDTHNAFLAGGPRKITPFFVPGSIINLISGQLSIMYGLKGPNLAVVTACTTANHSIGEAGRLIEYGDADVMIAGGSESCVSQLGIGGFCAARALSGRNDDPAIYCELAGYGMSADAHHITAPCEDGEGAVRCMNNAMRNAGITREQIDYVNAHGTSTPLGDIAETVALKSCFGDRAKKIAVSSTKSMTGHLLGAAGGIEAVFTALALRDQVAPPTINLIKPDPQCDLDYVPNEARKMKMSFAISNSFGFGGTNGSLVFRTI